MDTFYEEEVKPCIDNFNDLDSLSDFIKNQKEILEKLELIGDDERLSHAMVVIMRLSKNVYELLF